MDIIQTHRAIASLGGRDSKGRPIKKEPMESPFLEAALPKPAKNPSKADLIDTYVKMRDLDSHPELLPTLLKELSLTEFWEKIIFHPTYRIFRDLAEFRMLAGYEAGVFVGMTMAQLRVAVVVSALTCCVSATSKRGEDIYGSTATVLEHVPGFLDVKAVDVMGLGLDFMEVQDLAHVEKLTKSFARAVVTREKVRPDIIGMALADAYRFWPASKIPEVISTMTSMDRRPYLQASPRHTGRTPSAASLGYWNGISKIEKLASFHPTWATTKAWNRGLKQAVEQL